MTVWAPGLSLLAAIVQGSSAAAEGQIMKHPIRLIVEPAEDLVRFRVVGESKASCEARYALEVDVNRNRSVQRGNALLQPARPVTLATTSVSRSGPWTARLTVTPCSGPAYEELRSSEG